MLSFSGVEISAWGGGPDKGIGWYKNVTSNWMLGAVQQSNQPSCKSNILLSIWCIGYFIRLMHNSKYNQQVKETVSEVKPGH